MRKTIHSRRGFSLVELLITIAIIGIITAMVVIKYGGFNSSVLLKSQVYEIALDIREAQVFSVSERGQNGSFRNAYGIYFDKSTPNQYLLFVDSINPNDRYDSGEEVGEPITIDPRFQISQICVNSCGTDVNTLSITFKRPDFDAHMRSNGSQVSSGRVIVESVNDANAARAINISAAGQISVE